VVQELDAVSFEDLRVILCLEFDHRVPRQDIAAFKAQLAGLRETVQSMEITGSFDFLIELAMKDMATYSAWLETIADQMTAIVARYEVNFVSRRFVKQHPNSDAIWVPSNGDMQRVDKSLIDKVTAEGDYVRIHSSRGSWLMHATMRSMSELLGKDFIQIHRSTIVRCALVDRLIHRGRRWFARLEDGSQAPIAKSHVAQALQSIRNHSGSERDVAQITSAPMQIIETQS
jgi:two-component system response regulator AlgR